ncbi:MAG: hypothetical protein N2117_09635 [Anaerolineales bacterium]|nr:hypothetical protein [Anaerolineales bacterium]MCX7755490.1 hypothetical protein [Anaerolineales bacterium]MDW8278260.1 hypothetical protein [Anaerolineales bacterium]
MKVDFRSALTPRAFAGAILIALLLLALTFAWMSWSAPPPPDPAGMMAAMTLIPAPTGTPLPQIPTVDPYAPTPTPTLAPGQLTTGMYVQIVGTGGVGLNIRSAPGLDASPRFMGFDTEVFLIQDGPRERDGYTWWYIVSNYDDGRAGWAASNFLEAMPSPAP